MHKTDVIAFIFLFLLHSWARLTAMKKHDSWTGLSQLCIMTISFSSPYPHPFSVSVSLYTSFSLLLHPLTRVSILVRCSDA